MFDYHVHSHYSPDSPSTMEAMAEAARKIGLTGMAFTDHIEWEPGDDAHNYLQPAAYLADLERLRARYAGTLRILSGLELGNPHRHPAEAQALLNAGAWDYILGSVHWVDGIAGWEPPAFAEGIEVAYERYFQEVLLLAEEGDYDVLAHLDLVRRDSWSILRQTLPATAYEDTIRAILHAVIARGKGLEINLSPLGKGLEQPCPDLTILRWYRELGGEILVLGSDAHLPEHFKAASFARGRTLAQAAGFTRLARFAGRQLVGWTPLE